MLCTHPIAVGQVNAYGRGGIKVATKNGGTDNLGRNALYLLFLEFGSDGRVVLEPLGIGTELLCALCGIQVLEVDDTFP